MPIQYRPEEYAETKHPAPSWLFSTIFHVILLVVLAVCFGRTSGGTQSEPSREIAIAVAHRMPERTEYTTEATPEIQTSNQDTQSAASMAAAATAPKKTPIDLDGLLSSALDTPLPEGLPGEGETLSSVAPSTGDATMKLGPSGSQHTTEVFGIPGTGNRFLYVFDRSESMNGFAGRPLMAAKMQMIRSIQTLGPEQEFQIVFYNTQPRAFIPGGQIVRILKGDEQNLKMAEQYIRAMTAFGGTRHMDALLLALRMSPDVVFFLTDARVPRLTGRQLEEIKIRAARNDTTIHTIEFGDDLSEPTDSFLKHLAADNGGQYRYMHVGALRD